MNLFYIKDKNDCIDKEDKLKYDIFTKNGTLLYKKGQKYTEKINKIEIYIQNPTLNQKASEILSENKEKLKAKKIDKKTMELYENIYDTFKTTILEETLTCTNYINIDKAIDTICHCEEVPPTKLYNCIRIVRSKDNYTLHHSMSVMLLMYQALNDISIYSPWNNNIREYVRNISFTEANKKLYLIGSLLHDYGKIYIPNKILNKEGTLEYHEKNIIKQHPKNGVQALKKLKITNNKILRLVGNHHYNYMYYKGEQKSIETILNILDIYDACRSDRIYKKKMSLKNTIDILSKQRRYVGWDKFIIDFLIKTTINQSEAFSKISNS